MREMTFLDTTSLTPPVQKLKTKGAQKRKRYNLDDSSTTLTAILLGTFWRTISK